MKKYLLSKEGNFYKANLHCHTTISDGKLSPEQVKELYKSKGYSIVAYTDHDVLVAHPELNDDNFLALNGLEVEIRDGMLTDKDRVVGGYYDKNKQRLKVCHICFVALSPENLLTVGYNRENYIYYNNRNYRNKVVFDESKADRLRYYTPECINEIIKDGVDNGFFVTYNHPAWSMEDYRDYIAYNGMHAMEICNYSCFISGYEDYSPKIYDDMLRSGKRIYCIGADDNHNKYPATDRRSDSGGAYTVIKADKLDYKSVANSLINGNFYASQGPEIYELYYEDGKIYIKTSVADRIYLNAGARRHEGIFDQDGNGVTSAEFSVKETDGYVRFTVVDKFGKHANTNAYFIDELIK